MRTLALNNTVYPSLGMEDLVDKGIRNATFRIEQLDGYFVTFRKAVVDVVIALYHTNRNLMLKGEVYMNELYSFLGLPPTVWGEKFGWPVYDEMYWLDFELDYDEVSDTYLITPFVSPVNIKEFYEEYY